MSFSVSTMASLATYIAKNKMNPRPEWQKTVKTEQDNANPFRIVRARFGDSTGKKPHPMIQKRFPLVLQLEPLHACNLTCTGCGRIREYESTITQQLSLEQCLKASDECGAPVVAICGGEPMLYGPLPELVRELNKRGRLVILCTNGMFITKKLHLFEPNDNFFFNVHLDGMEKNHDIAVEREGVFKLAIEGIRAAKAAGFKVCTNTTVYKETDMDELVELFTLLKEMKVDGHSISPAYGYSAVNDREIFMTREDILEKFRGFREKFDKFKFNNSPVYLEFLEGKRELPCTAWGNPTYNVKGWKGPCYLITDGHYDTFEELMTKTPWENYGHGADPRCDHCMVHCGYEPSAAMGINSKWQDAFTYLSWMIK
jgi:hopanoid biosynthesis associated radical SAM protein HpnH